MSRAARRREERSGGKGTPGRSRTPLWIMSGSVLAALLIVGVVGQTGRQQDDHHPMPRMDAHEAHVMPAARYAEQGYAMAAEIPAVLDGIYCYCLCHDTFGHYSLLDCFMGDHGANCDVCINEAEIAYQMTQRGESLDQIRVAIDGRYRT
jgi:hypothetical protein